MGKLKLHIISLLTIVLLLSGCFSADTPQEVTESFWQAVIQNDKNNIIKYSTLTDIEQYDAFSHDWSQSQASLGKVTIEGNRASIVTSISGPGDPDVNNKKFITYLFQHNEQWKVDYARTRDDMQSDMLTNIFGQLSQLGENISENISQQFNISAENFDAEMEKITRELEQLSSEINQQATINLKRYAESLRYKLDELAKSVERVLQEQKDKLTKKDKDVLTKVANDLNQNSENVSQQPGLQSITEGSQAFARAQYQLEKTEGAVVEKYKTTWHEWAKNFETDMQKLINDLQAHTAEENQQ